MKLTREQLYTLTKAVEVHESSIACYEANADDQRRLWQFEQDRARKAGDEVISQDRWILELVRHIDAVRPTAELYLLDSDIEVTEQYDQALEIAEDPPRIVLWRDLVAFYGHGAAVCVLYLAGTSRYMSMDAVWAMEALGMLAVSRRPATPRSVGNNERYTLHRAHYRPRRNFYYVSNVRYEVAPKREPRGGHHASPIAHDRSAHRALLTRVGVDTDDEIKDLIARQYTIVLTEDLPPNVLERMVRRGKQPIPGTRNAYRWIEKSAARVNPDGELARRVTMIR